jgi:8-oxo-dGTP pyrophosphatase MutT (NUDIX family)
MSFLDRVRACGNFDPKKFLPFLVDGDHIGFVAPEFAARLLPFGDVFVVSAESVTLAPGLVGFAGRTSAIDRALRHVAEDGGIAGWRNEPFPVGRSFAAPPLFHMERAAVALFGVRAYGVHLNGIVRDGDGLKMWVGRRSLDKFTAPGKLDQLVAGGQPAGLTLLDNLIKESAEEANIPKSLAARSIPVGAVSYCGERENGLRRDVLFLYDLTLPRDFVPRNTDGEISEFYLWPIDRVIETVRDTDDFKFNCAMVVIDFLIRHGYIEPDSPEYVDLVLGLRSG